MLPSLTWAQELPTSEGRPYLRRWILDLGPFAIRLHHWLCSDDERAPHDHPYWMAILVLHGGYFDVEYPVHDLAPSLDHVVLDRLRVGSVRLRRPEHVHYVKVMPGGCWSLLLTGRQSRVWGFWTKRYDQVRRFERSSRYFRKNGRHVCDRDDEVKIKV